MRNMPLPGLGHVDEWDDMHNQRRGARVNRSWMNPLGM